MHPAPAAASDRALSSGRGRVVEGRAEVRAVLRGYVGWAMRHPERFRPTYGRWTRADAALTEAGADAHAAFTAAVGAAQERGDLPPGEPARVGSLLVALANGAASLALAGHLARDGKGGVDPEDLVADLLDYMRP